LEPPPHTYVDVADLPAEWNWADVNGVNYLTPTRNKQGEGEGGGGRGWKWVQQRVPNRVMQKIFFTSSFY